MHIDMGQFLAKMEEKATYIKTKRVGLRTSKSKDNLSDYELSKMTLYKNVPRVWTFFKYNWFLWSLIYLEYQERPKLSEEEFAAILEKHSHLAEYDVVTKLLETIPEDCSPDLVDKLVKENQGNQLTWYKSKEWLVLKLIIGYLDVVNYRLFELISTESFMQGVVQIGDIGSNLESSMILAKNGRRVIQHAMENFKGVFTVFQKLQRRHMLMKIAEDLERVQKVLTNHEQLQLAHSRGDYPEAVRLFLICLENMKACSRLAIVNELASILQETYPLSFFFFLLSFLSLILLRYTQIQVRLDKALVDCCRSFNPITYHYAHYLYLNLLHH